MATCINRYTGQRYYCRSRWGDWGRWVALVVILVVFFLFFFCCACISQRRRRKAGRTPFYGTGWTTKLPMGGTGQTYNPQYQNNTQNPPPQYNQYVNNDSAPQGGYSGGVNQTYFGGRDTEMQPPQNVYNSSNTYAPPAGPPPPKNY